MYLVVKLRWLWRHKIPLATSLKIFASKHKLLAQLKWPTIWSSLFFSLFCKRLNKKLPVASILTLPVKIVRCGLSALKMQSCVSSRSSNAKYCPFTVQFTVPRWLLLGILVQKVFETNLTFRYQGVKNLKK